MAAELLVVGTIRNGAAVLLVRQPGPVGPGTAWALPGGRVSGNEVAVSALCREIREETGLTVSCALRLLCVGPNPGGHTKICSLNCAPRGRGLTTLCDDTQW